MKKAFLLCFLVLMMSLATALSISAPAELSENSILYFNAVLDSGQFTESKIYLDNSLMATSYAGGGAHAHSPQVVSTFTMDSGNKVYVVVAGLSVGSHTLKVVEKNEGSLVAEEAHSFKVYSKVPSNFVSETESKLTELDSSLSSVSTDVQGMKSDVQSAKASAESAQTTATQVQADMQSTKSEVQSLQSLRSLPSEIQSLESKINQTESGIAGLEGEIQGLKSELEKKMDNPITGLSALGTSSTSIFLGIIILVVIIVAFLYFKAKGRISFDSIYSRKEKGKPEDFFEEPKKDLSSIQVEEKTAEKKEAEETEIKKGKWAYRGSLASNFKPEKEEKRFTIKDLLKK